ncbi:MAG: Clp protease [Geodermatophilaceae bacterium]|nr:Clp protease [Geodermatophilaceae bacterium]
MFERFTSSAREVVVAARREAKDVDHSIAGTEHLLLALVQDSDGLGGRALRRLGLDPVAVRHSIDTIRSRGPVGDLDVEALGSIGIDLDAVRRRVDAAFGPGALDRAGPTRRWRSPFSPRAKKALELSLRESIRRKDGYIGTEHLLLGVLREGRGMAARILADAAIDRTAVESMLDTLRGSDEADTG